MLLSYYKEQCLTVKQIVYQFTVLSSFLVEDVLSILLVELKKYPLYIKDGFWNVILKIDEGGRNLFYTREQYYRIIYSTGGRVLKTYCTRTGSTRNTPWLCLLIDKLL